MTALHFRILGVLILLIAWVLREMWTRKQGQRITVRRQQLDAKARAEDARLSVQTQSRIFDYLVHLQTVIGFLDEAPIYSIDDTPSGVVSPQKAKYLASIQEFKQQLSNSTKSYAVQRLQHVWSMAKGQNPSQSQIAGWINMKEEDVMNLGNNLIDDANRAGDRLERSVEWGDYIAAGMYIIGTLFVLVSG